MMAISMVRAKALCSGAELALVKASSKQEIGTHTAARLKQKQARARKLRDKWRDQVAAQRRTAKSKTGAAEGDKNSAEKAELFDEVLTRFTAQLEKAESAGKTPGPMGRRRSTKTARSRTHRASRAEVRGELAEAKREIKAKAKTKKKAAPAKVKAKPVVAAEPVVKEAAPAAASTMVKGADTPPKPKRSRVPVAAGASAIVAGARRGAARDEARSDQCQCHREAEPAQGERHDSDSEEPLGGEQAEPGAAGFAVAKPQAVRWTEHSAERAPSLTVRFTLRRVWARNVRVTSCCGVVEDRVRRAGFGDAAGVHDVDRVRHVAGEAHRVGDDDHRLAALGQVGDDARSPRRPCAGRGRWWARRRGSPRASSPACGRWRRAAAGRRRVGRASR